MSEKYQDRKLVSLVAEIKAAHCVEIFTLLRELSERALNGTLGKIEISGVHLPEDIKTIVSQSAQEAAEQRVRYLERSSVGLYLMSLANVFDDMRRTYDVIKATGKFCPSTPFGAQLSLDPEYSLLERAIEESKASISGQLFFNVDQGEGKD